MHLGLDDDELVACVACGLCLPHCPTFTLTGSDTESPRGRIALMRAVQHDGAPVTEAVLDSFATCVQCRACETACPSAVPFGRLMEGTRSTLAAQGEMTPRWLKFGLRFLLWRRVLLAGSTLMAVAIKLRLLPARRLGLPQRMPLRRPPLRASGNDVWLFTGCVMDAWQRDVHLAVQRVLEAAGVGVAPTGGIAPCCGAMHIHAGLEAETTKIARRTIEALSGDDRPILVDSAGCGASMKDYGHLLGTAEAKAFSARVFDVSEWLAPRVDDLVERNRGFMPLDVAVAVQDPCHLRHVQRSHQGVYEVLAPFVSTVKTLDDDGMCCGAGGAYSVLQPDLSKSIRARKVESVHRSGAGVVASANPGCYLHLAAAGLDVRHPLELVDEALASSRPSVRSAS